MSWKAATEQCAATLQNLIAPDPPPDNPDALRRQGFMGAPPSGPRATATPRASRSPGPRSPKRPVCVRIRVCMRSMHAPVHKCAHAGAHACARTRFRVRTLQYPRAPSRFLLYRHNALLKNRTLQMLAKSSPRKPLGADCGTATWLRVALFEQGWRNLPHFWNIPTQNEFDLSAGNPTKLGRSWQRLARFRSDFGQSWSISAETRPRLP